MVLRQSIRFISEFMISLINTRYLDLFPLYKNALNTEHVFDFDTRLTGLIDCLVDWTKKDPSHKKLMFVFCYTLFAEVKIEFEKYIYRHERNRT